MISIHEQLKARHEQENLKLWECYLGQYGVAMPAQPVQQNRQDIVSDKDRDLSRITSVIDKAAAFTDEEKLEIKSKFGINAQLPERDETAEDAARRHEDIQKQRKLLQLALHQFLSPLPVKEPDFHVTLRKKQRNFGLAR